MAEIQKTMTFTTECADITISVASQQMVLTFYLKNGQTIEKCIRHCVKTDGEVIDNQGLQVYAQAPGTLVAKLQDLLTAVTAYETQAADDEKF